MKRFYQLVLSLSLGLLPVLGHAAAIPLKTECVGYYSISLPEKVETALYLADEVEGRSEKKIKFNDNKIAYYSRFIYNNIKFKITTQDKVALTNYFALLRSRIDELVQKDPNVTTKITPNLMSVYDRNGFSFFYLGDRLYSFSTDKYRQHSSRLDDFYQQSVIHLRNDFSTRDMFEIPPQQGFCIPYGYIANSPERMASDIGVTYRLVEHPDITIFFKVSSGEFDPDPDYWEGSAKDMVKTFWDSTYDVDVKEHHLLGTPRYKTIRMDGRMGKGAFVEVRYEDGRTPDYGYYSLVRIVAEADKDTPELSMYVIGKASESKGKTPLTKDEIYELAKTIEASIERRVFK